MKVITTYLDSAEWQDFSRVKCAFERKTNSDTIRAMISFCKKNLLKNIRDANNAQKTKEQEQ